VLIEQHLAAATSLRACPYVAYTAQRLSNLAHQQTARRRTIASRPVCEGARLHFVDDRLETLKAAVEAGLLEEGWALYLAEWWVDGWQHVGWMDGSVS